MTDEGERPDADGLARDDAGGIYFGAYDQRSLVRRKPDGGFCVVAHDERLGWPRWLVRAGRLSLRQAGAMEPLGRVQ